MIVYHIYKAQETIKTVPVESVVIKIEMPVPEFNDLDESVAIFEHQAQKLCKVLYDVLPGGTFDRLVAAMLQKEASLFKVSHKELEN